MPKKKKPWLETIQNFEPLKPDHWYLTHVSSVERAGKGNTVSLTVDGKPVEGNVIPLPPAGQTDVRVRVALT